MRQRFWVPSFVMLVLAAVALVGCGGSGAQGDQEGPTAIPIGDLVTPTRMAEQVMITPTLQPSPVEQVMATPAEQVMATPTEQVMPTPTETPVVEPSPTPEPTEPPTLTPTATSPEAPSAEEETSTPEATAEAAAEPTPTPTPEPTPELAPEPATHTVQPGENLFRIGLRYGVSWQEIAAANNLPAGNHIQVGQVLTIPVEPTPATPGPKATEAHVHVVQPGETLYRIGLQYNVPWDVIAQANNITNPNTIYVGQELTIPGSAGSQGAAAETGAAGPTTHVVQSGETLFRIGLRYGLSWQVIAEANGITNPNLITAGMVLTIPTP